MAPGRRSSEVGKFRCQTTGTHDQQFSRPPAVYSGVGSADRIRIAAIPGQFANSHGVQRARFADEFGGERRSVSESDRRDRASNLRVGSKAVPWLAEDAPALLPKPRGPGEMAAALAYRHHRSASP